MPPEASSSPDQAVRLLSARLDGLESSLSAMRRSLVAYASRVAAREERPPVSPLEHYSMLDAPDCGCATCMDWELRRREFLDSAVLVPKGHKWTTCACPDCRFVGRLHLNYLAATNRRDLLIEMSFHARYHSRHGERVMAWLDAEMAKPSYTVNWCAQEMSRYPMERWMQRCEAAVSGAVSGAVFTDAAGVVALESFVGSTLGVEVGSSFLFD